MYAAGLANSVTYTNKVLEVVGRAFCIVPLVYGINTLISTIKGTG